MLIVFDTELGKQITQLESVPVSTACGMTPCANAFTSRGMGSLQFISEGRRRLHAMVKVATEADSQPSIWVPQFNRLYFSVPQAGNRDAEILVYEP